MERHLDFYIDGRWTKPAVAATREVVDPASEEAFAAISQGSLADVDAAVAAARRAFPAYALTSREQRLALFARLIAAYDARAEDLARAVSREMGAPLKFARDSQAPAGRVHLEATARALKTYEFSRRRGTTLIVEEPIGVCALITPWNWPLNQIACKVAPALAAGCAMVLKPSEIAPLSALVFAEIVEAAGVPAGVFNLVNGDGPTVGQALVAHPDVDMASFTGSTRAGVAVAKAAADTVKRVAQELGGKSANLILRDADFASAVREGALACFSNSGQSCDAPTRLLVPAERGREAAAIAAAAAASLTVGDPDAPGTDLGPVASRAQFDKVQRLIASGIAEGATLVAGGLGRPEGLNRGYYVRPTVFADVKPAMRIAQEEIFGPVLSILAYVDEDEAVAIANQTNYGLAAYVSSRDLTHARAIAARLRAGTVNVNYPAWDVAAPFGGYKQSGNGREYADYGMREYLETKAIVGWGEGEKTKRRQIPDSQILDAADQYEIACELLSAQPPRSGILLPLLNSAAIAIELYLKCLSAQRIYTADEMMPDVSLVTARATVAGHSLKAVFEAVPNDVRMQLTTRYDEQLRPALKNEFLAELEAIEGAFQTSRYPFERDRDVRGYRPQPLVSIAKFLRVFAHSLPQKEFIQR